MLISALILGLVSSLHCIAMCGPIAMMLPVSRTNRAKRAFQVIVYHTGRISSYALLGIVFGVLGRGLYLAGMQQWLSIFAGVIMISLVVIPEKKLARYNFSKPFFSLIAKAKSAMGQRLRNPSISSLLLIGILNGLLPCTMVYAALFGALATHDVFSGAVYMMFFGLGTVPLMSGVSVLWKAMTIPVRNKIQKVIPFAMILIGVLFILRGLSLGISFSPSTLSLIVRETPDCH